MDTLSASTSEDPTTLEDVFEPYLLQIGFIARTPRGRVALERAYQHLGKNISAEKQEELNKIKDELSIKE